MKKIFLLDPDEDDIKEKISIKELIYRCRHKGNRKKGNGVDFIDILEITPDENEEKRKLEVFENIFKRKKKTERKKSFLGKVLNAAKTLFSGKALSSNSSYKIKNDILEIKKPLENYLMENVKYISETIGERHYKKMRKLEACENFIISETEKMKNIPFEIKKIEYTAKKKLFNNIEISLPNKENNLPAIIVGGHYDSVKGTPGADDNGSAVSGLLGIMKILNDNNYKNKHPFKFVFFVNEEPPFFKTKKMGSYKYCEYLDANNIEVDISVILEMIGYFNNEKSNLPLMYKALLPETNNYAAVISDSEKNSCSFCEILKAHSAQDQNKIKILSTGYGSIMPDNLIDLSDHWSFWKFGYPSLMITDTAFLRNDNYHKKTDTWDTLNYLEMSKLVINTAKSLTEYDLSF